MSNADAILLLLQKQWLDR